jgi:hypothetical protein
VRPLRAGLVDLHSGGSGTPPGRHYDRSARSSLHWPVCLYGFKKRGPELARSFHSATNAAVERREAWCPDRKGRRRASQARRISVAPFGAPLPSLCEGLKAMPRMGQNRRRVFRAADYQNESAFSQHHGRRSFAYYSKREEPRFAATVNGCGGSLRVKKLRSRLRRS